MRASHDRAPQPRPDRIAHHLRGRRGGGPAPVQGRRAAPRRRPSLAHPCAAAVAPFIGAIVLYAALSVLWVWLLTFTPLSRAYPFVAVAFALTPVLGALVFAEPLSACLLVGIAVIACGLVLVVS